MKLFLNSTQIPFRTEAFIKDAKRRDLPPQREGWQFRWRTLGRVEGGRFYKLTTKKAPARIEGMLMLTLFNDEMVYMNNIEVAPHNFGQSKRFQNVAGCLLAYACYKSFEWGRGDYQGFLAFDSKTQLIELYQQKYGATHARGHKMFFDPTAGQALMETYLGIKFYQ